MWAAKKPNATAEETATLCAKGLRDAALKASLLAAIPDLTKNSVEFQTNGSFDLLHTSKSENYPVAVVSAPEMRWLYTNRLARTGRPGRKIYDDLMSAAPHGLCVYCRYGAATTLDHYVPKTVVPSLALEPWNLVPCCQQCNHELGAAWSDQPDAQKLHPYFLPDVGRWLRAKVERVWPAVVTFYADPDPGLGELLGKRIRNQFNDLGLGKHYSVVSSAELSGLNELLPQRFQDATQLRDHLLEISSDAFCADFNDRRGAMYEALGHDDWYIAQNLGADDPA